jgi:GPH family glycoside/pentoside/hexuronide:cation symporter|tara:strand:- start:28754 stop:30184 length:1431 start_codon:yes stop_codon:yes gene_type:complete
VSDAKQLTKQVPVWSKVAYGFGSVAYGVKDNGFNYFFLIFYSQVMGVDAYLVALALMIAMGVDALSDPLIGYFSDNTRSRWGRRHPYMYFAAIPVSIAYYLMWNPPGSLEGNDLFPFIVTVAILVRTLITLYEIPSSALVAEMTDDYDERTSMLSYRYFFGWTGGTIMSALALAFLLVPTEEIKDGMFNVAGHGQVGFVAACVIFTAIICSALGTHRQIPNLNPPPPKRKMTIKRIYGEIFETLATGSFAALFVSALFGSIATGVAAGLSYYISTFYWEFTTQEIGILSITVVLSALIGFLLAPIVSRKIGKRKGAMAVGILAFTINPLPIVLRMLGWMPENGDPMLFPIILIVNTLDVGLIVTYQILAASMIADLVEDSEIRTARRSEGVFFASVTFVRKVVQGFGAMMAATILTLSEFPVGATPGTVPEEALITFALYYVPTVFTVWMLMIFSISFYQVDREKHQQNLESLGRR